MVGSPEGYIIGKICEHHHMMPYEVLKNKYSPNMRFLWRYYFNELKAKMDVNEKLKNKEV